jgi:hypothetical protein
MQNNADAIPFSLRATQRIRKTGEKIAIPQLILHDKEYF